MSLDKLERAISQSDLSQVEACFVDLTPLERGLLLVSACEQPCVEIPLLLLSEGVQGMSRTDVESAAYAAVVSAHKPILERLNDLKLLDTEFIHATLLSVVLVVGREFSPSQVACLQALLPRADPNRLLDMMLESHVSIDVTHDHGMFLLDLLSPHLAPSQYQVWLARQDEAYFPKAAEREQARQREQVLAQIKPPKLHAMRPRS